MASRNGSYHSAGVATRSRTSSSSPRWAGRSGAACRPALRRARLPLPPVLGTVGQVPRGSGATRRSSASARAVADPPSPDQRSGQPVAMLGEVVPEAALHAGGALVRGALLDPGRGDPHQLVRPGRAGRSGSRRRSRDRPTGRSGRAAATASGAKRCRGMTSKMAPVGQTRTHSPHQVQPAWSGSPSPPTMISVCAPRSPTSSTPTSWMSSQARTHRVQRMQSDMSCWIITSPGRVSPPAEPERAARAARHLVLARRTARTRSADARGRRSARCSPG